MEGTTVNGGETKRMGSVNGCSADVVFIRDQAVAGLLAMPPRRTEPFLVNHEQSIFVLAG